MLDIQDLKTKERVNQAIANIRLIATRTKKTSVQDAKQRAEITVSLLSEFRQYVNTYNYRQELAGVDTAFKHNRETLARIVQATFQADTIHSFLTRENKKRYDQEYHQVVILLENIHTYLFAIVEKGLSNA